MAAATAQVRARLNIVSNSCWYTLHDTVANVMSILRIVLRLLAVDQCNSIDIIILMVCMLISSHYEIFFRLFQANRAYRLGTFTRNINVGHILIRATTRLWWNLILPGRLANCNRIAQLALRADGR